jgi:hypothetical protein
MIHGIYVKNRPKGTWQLVSVALSAEAVNQDISKITKQAEQEGKEGFQVGFQIFDSEYHIPEYLKELKEQKLVYN